MKRFINWLLGRKAAKRAAPKSALTRTGVHQGQTGTHLRQTGGHTLSKRASRKPATPKSQPEFVELDPHVGGRIEDNGPGKNVLIRNRYLREDTGTHETLKILDDSILENDDEEGIDPYNTGQFDRSRNWDKRSK